MLVCRTPASSAIFCFNDTATTEIYTLSLHDALPIYFKTCTGKTLWVNSIAMILASHVYLVVALIQAWLILTSVTEPQFVSVDRKSTRLNSSHANISYAVFCLKKKHKSI